MRSNARRSRQRRRAAYDIQSVRTRGRAVDTLRGQSTCEAEYIAAAVLGKSIWRKGFTNELHTPGFHINAVQMNIDNSAMKLARNLQNHGGTDRSRNKLHIRTDACWYAAYRILGCSEGFAHIRYVEFASILWRQLSLPSVKRLYSSQVLGTLAFAFTPGPISSASAGDNSMARIPMSVATSDVI